ncbi:MAG TPA: MATE family efflux transporter, partial [Eubacterium sp.]|nr:MATE family efflux transporter [Eubacterium sp.]
MKNKNDINMCEGPLLGKILLFAIPLMLSSVLQLAFNAADIIVVGRFESAASLAAVGSTSPVINLLTNLFMGLSIGANVCVSNYIGAKKSKDVRETVHTAMYMAIISGLIMTVIGCTFAGPILRAMGAPFDILGLAKNYLTIYCLGMTASMIYNFGAAILRSVGDTK